MGKAEDDWIRLARRQGPVIEAALRAHTELVCLVEADKLRGQPSPFTEKLIAEIGSFVKGPKED